MRAAHIVCSKLNHLRFQLKSRNEQTSKILSHTLKRAARKILASFSLSKMFTIKISTENCPFYTLPKKPLHSFCAPKIPTGNPSATL
jgi:hypothetical protein